MGPRFKDITGQRFHRFTAVAFVGRDATGSKAMWECVCDCGATRIVAGSDLRSGNYKSCGCDRGKHLVTHGLTHTRIYRVWAGMCHRCFSPKSRSYKDYGGRGIKICDRWLDPAKFAADMGPGYKTGMSLDRIDNDGDYTPSNCRWANWTSQGRNRRTNRLIEINGEVKCVTEWAELHNINRGTFEARLARGVPPLEALSLPLQPGKRLLNR